MIHHTQKSPDEVLVLHSRNPQKILACGDVRIDIFKSCYLIKWLKLN